jgi:hypothetical protein
VTFGFEKGGTDGMWVVDPIDVESGDRGHGGR